MKQYFDQTAGGVVAPLRFTWCPRCANRLPDSGKARCPECGYVQYHNPLPGVSVLIRDGANRVLVGRRLAAPELWALPCGFIESDENFLEAAHREVREETGLRICIRSVINVVSNVIHETLESLVVVLLADLETLSGDVAGAGRPGDDLVELRWITGEDVPALAFEADRFLISEYYRATLAEIAVDPRFASSG